MTKKKFILSLTVVFFALLLLFTFISKSVYNATLPVVTTAKAVKGSISQTKTLEGEFSYSDASKVTARDNWRVTEVMVETGRQVDEGTPLFAIDVSDYRVQRQNYADSLLKISTQLEELDAQAEAEEIANARKLDELKQQVKLLNYQIRNINGIYPSSSYTMVQRQNYKRNFEMDLVKAENSIAALEEQSLTAEDGRQRTRKELASQQEVIAVELDELDRRYPADGVVRAEEVGLVDAVLVEEGKEILRGEDCVTMHRGSSDIIIEFDLSVEEGESFQKLSTVSVEYSKRSWDEVRRVAITETDTKMAEDHTRQMDPNGKVWHYKSVMKDMESPPVSKKAKVTIGAMSGYFENVLPASCVKKDADKEYVLAVKEKDSLFGKAYYVEKVEVETKAKNSKEVAVTSKDVIGAYEIVETTTLPVYPGMTVLVR